MIEPWEGGFRVRDLGSANGTKLNDEKVSTDFLDNGDIVIPRIRPGERQGGDKPDKKAKPATPPKLEETRA